MPFAKLTPETIVDEAIALMHQEGLDSVTLRAVAARLDARAPSLYRHIADKDALYSLMSERIFRGCVTAVREESDWREWLREFARSLWTAQSGGAGVLRLIQVRAQEDSVMTAMRDSIVETLIGLGLDRDLALVALRSVQAMVTGWTTLRRDTDPAAAEAHLFESIDALIVGWDQRAGSA
jgi:TetR/AcrR family tetracycline transcriptional repressor